jgi:hypothetical protein
LIVPSANNNSLLVTLTIHVRGCEESLVPPV